MFPLVVIMVVLVSVFVSIIIFFVSVRFVWRMIVFSLLAVPSLWVVGVALLFLLPVTVTLSLVKSGQAFLFNQVYGSLSFVGKAVFVQTFRFFTPFVHVDDFKGSSCWDSNCIGHETLVCRIGDEAFQYICLEEVISAVSGFQRNLFAG